MRLNALYIVLNRNQHGINYTVQQFLWQKPGVMLKVFTGPRGFIDALIQI